MREIRPIPLRPALLHLRGISPRQIMEHFNKLYLGYVKTINEIKDKLQFVKKEPSTRYSEYRELKLEETFNIDGVKLHELYFNNLGGRGGKADGPILHALHRNFGSFTDWAEDFIAAGGSARGWVTLSYDFRDGRLHNYLLEAHNIGVVEGTATLLVLDVYEHAYFIDYGADREPYLEAFMDNIDWDVVNMRFMRLFKKDP